MTKPKKKWFVCQECDTRITTERFPVRCAQCETIWLDKKTRGVEGWDFVSNDQLVNVVCRRFIDDARVGEQWKVAVMSAVSSKERKASLARLQEKYGKTGDGVPWQHVTKDGGVVVPYANGEPVKEGAPKKKRGRSKDPARTVSKAQAEAALSRLKGGETTLIAESNKLGFSHNGPLRAALRELMGHEEYREFLKKSMKKRKK